MILPETSFAWPELEDLEPECLPQVLHPATIVNGADSWVDSHLSSHVPCRTASNNGPTSEPSPDWPHKSQADFSQRVTQDTSPAQSLSGIQDKKLANRAHQKRFRERQKVRTKAVADQLAQTTEELQQLRLQRQELEIKLEQAQVQIEAKLKGEFDDATLQHAQQFGFNMPFVISLPGQKRTINVDDAERMTADQYVSIWEAYCHELKQHSTSSQHNNSTMNSGLCQMTLEAWQFRAFCATYLPDQAGGKSYTRPHLKNPALPLDRVTHIAETLNLSDSQVHDLMFLRRVYVLRRHQLDSQRAELQAQLQESSQKALYAASRLKILATKLQHNTSEDMQVLLRFSWAMYFGIFTIRQAAQLLLNLDPRHSVREALWNHLAKQYGYPTPEQVTENAPFGPTECDWNRAWQYTESVSPFCPVRTSYVPLPKGLPATILPL